MTRIRANFEFGTISDNPLSSGATTSNSTQYANLPIVASPDVLAITLDPKAVVGNPEIVYVTAHTAGATTVTISRAQEGTTARSHNQNEIWVHALTAYDLSNTQPPTTSNVTDSATAGSGPAFALADHLHGREGFDSTSPSTLGLASGAAGTSPNPAHHDHVHDASAVTPSTSIASDSATSGSSGIATGDHKHGREGYGTSVTVSSASDAVDPGTQTTVSRSDHTHGREGYGASASTSAVGDAQVPGSATTLSRADHKHGREAFGNPVQSVYTDTMAQGTATSIARADHRHARPTPIGTIAQMDGTTPTYGSQTYATISGYGPPVTGVLTVPSSALLMVAWRFTGTAQAVGAIVDSSFAVGFSTSGGLTGTSWGGVNNLAVGQRSGNVVGLGGTSMDSDQGGGVGNFGLVPETRSPGGFVIIWLPDQVGVALHFYLLWAITSGSGTGITCNRRGTRDGTYIQVTTLP